MSTDPVLEWQDYSDFSLARAGRMDLRAEANGGWTVSVLGNFLARELVPFAEVRVNIAEGSTPLGAAQAAKLAAEHAAREIGYAIVGALT